MPKLSLQNLAIKSLEYVKFPSAVLNDKTIQEPDLKIYIRLVLSGPSEDRFPFLC